MADAHLPSLSRAREEKISELSTIFANDDLSLEELERRIERVYKAANVSELDAITADLKRASAPPTAYARAKVARATPSLPQPADLESRRVMSVMSTTRRLGRWAVPRRLDIVGIMADTRIDMTHASLPAGIIDVDLRVIMGSFRLVVPPNMRVINEAHVFMSAMKSNADEMAPDGAPATPNAPVIRLTGMALMSDVSIVVRRREDAVYDDDEDD
jgi:hypothetical protein